MKKTKLIFMILCLSIPFWGMAQEDFELDFDKIEPLYQRLNKNQQSDEDLLLLDQLKENYRGLLEIYKIVEDKNGGNTLEIKVVNPYDPSLPPSAMINTISIEWRNKHYVSKQFYYNETVLDNLILLRPENILLEKVSRKTLIVIPFTYIGNADTDMTVSYAIMYDKQTYLLHISYFRNWEVDENCWLNDDLDKKLKPITDRKLKKMLHKKIDRDFHSSKYFGDE